MGLLSSGRRQPGPSHLSACCHPPRPPPHPAPARSLPGEHPWAGEAPSSWAAFSGAPPSDFPLRLTSEWVRLSLNPSRASGAVGPLGLGGCSLRRAGFGFEVGGWKGREGRLAAGVPAARHLRQVRSERPGRRFWTRSPGTSRISTTWEPVRPVPRPHPARLLNQKLRGGVCELFSQPSG